MLALEQLDAPRDTVEAVSHLTVAFAAQRRMTIAEGRAIILWCEWIADGPAIQCEHCDLPDAERRRSCLSGPCPVTCIARRTGLSRFAVHRAITEFKRFLRSPV
jgi:Zn finger protein HypA/HybF involved in hydrogenase expression